MIRLLIPVLLAFAVCGCQGQNPQVPMDPFYGQTKIAPPGTGEIARRASVDPYYPRSAAVTTPSATIQPPPIGDQPSQSPVSTAHLASNASVGNEKTSPVPNGDRIEIPLSARRELSPAEMLAAKSFRTSEPQQPADAASSTAASAGLPRQPQQVTQTLSPRDKSLAGQSSRYSRPSPAYVSPRSAPVDINNLPPVDRGAGTLRDEQVRQASATQADAGVTVRIPSRIDSDSTKGRFGWADDYSRLRGQLEYLESEQSWKLRYIPVDKKTDDYGGSVLIEDAASVSGFERGDFVEVRGHIAKEPDDSTDFAPVYQVASIRSLGD